MKKIIYILFTISIITNVYFVGKFGLQKLNEPTYELGILNESIDVGLFGQSGTIFKLPKGLTVENIAPRGINAIGQFENERFSIIITSDQRNLVNYDVKEDKIHPNGNYYSADFPVMEKRNENKAKSFMSGDLIFQTSKSKQSKAIQLATNSKYSHVGLIYKKANNFYVYGAVQPVKLTPINDWIKRGENGDYVVKRLINSKNILTPENLTKLKAEGEKYRNKNYDIYFDWSDNKMYCSELIWKMYKRALNIEIGKLEKLSDFDLTDPEVKKIIIERYGNEIPLDETVISPVSMFNSNKLIKVVINE